ncbi:AmmeMemoRadiSam system radical SAM enzyme [Geobacter hydrogenophilus]|uniref:AmmeMemoRadiSam system radical SAM enzyme n=1 Tax=Geobacter hydrogenophilus TaxID=40983 RepID=A0A9W6LA54_9BACT|nr:AmmeMemoRadiSam system radical SAM enzyme [Geobacter hydrogenophilus]MBT0895009.1 AmmeMemoRadiSam system radical SAM enzyme [Geobacter hydrogenophilus]GLI37018.1 AmmeMemoRadiSam system radical SAM enzyme [Geobacter hydrogenophilus]
MKEAMFYTRESDTRVQCGLCRHRCMIADGARGICAVRENRGGTLYSLVYGKLVAENVDPIEKKPLFHVLPGSKSFSIATMGCNFRCHHCQNYSISQVAPQGPVAGIRQTPESVVGKALATGSRSIAYTYTEPTIFFEFAYDTARLARQAGLLNVFVTNGYITREALTTIAPYLDAANIDLKGFTEGFYRDYVHGRLSEVLDSIIEYRKQGIWIELTTLVIPGLNDSDGELKGIASFIVDNLGADTPWHVTQFYPTYKLTDRPRTPVETLRRARDIGKSAGLNYVYEGNVPGEGGENTWCPSCSALLIERYGYLIENNQIRDGGCPDCGTTIVGIGM